MSRAQNLIPELCQCSLERLLEVIAQTRTSCPQLSADIRPASRVDSDSAKSPPPMPFDAGRTTLAPPRQIITFNVLPLPQPLPAPSPADAVRLRPNIYLRPRFSHGDLTALPSQADTLPPLHVAITLNPALLELPPLKLPRGTAALNPAPLTPDDAWRGCAAWERSSLAAFNWMGSSKLDGWRERDPK